MRPFAPKWHFLCENEPILAPNVECHPRHPHGIHIQTRVKMKLWETLLCVILPHILYIYMDKEKKKNFTLSDTGIHFVSALITSFRHWAIDGVSEGGISLTGNYEKELIWPSLAARKREGERERRGDRGEGWIDGVKGGLRRKCLHRGQDPEERTWIMRALSSPHTGARHLIHWKIPKEGQ